MKLEDIANSALKVIKNGLKDKKVQGGYAIYGLGILSACALSLNKQNLTADYLTNLSNTFLFVNMCHHIFMGINNSYPKL